LEGADLRGANVEGLDLSALGLRGVRLDVGQAVALAHSLGASVHLEI
jgi:fluoroquinolone resistance protein